jgi:indole-3-glycerol phosphate synthase/phosphoribosylanthranilate isomerase
MSDTTILDEIVQSRRNHLRELKRSLSLADLESRLQPADRDFAAALRDPQPGFILECKKASPSRGVIRADFDLPAIARSYGPFASAISVLTEPKYFQGSADYLGTVRQLVNQPLLCKDFIVDPWQVLHARHCGADAVLLILAILDDPQWKQLADLAGRWNMAVLTEVSNVAERDRAVSLGAAIVGINNRNLRDMSINLDTTRQLASGLPPQTQVISESGYYTNQQVRAMSDCADGFLIGSSLMGQPRLSRAVRRLIFGDCKVCGLTRNQDAVASDLAGATYGGVIFSRRSPRFVEPDEALAVFQDTGLLRTGVFQNQSPEQIIQVASACRLDVIQLHGDETPQTVGELLSGANNGYEVWKAMSVEQWRAEADAWLAAGVSKVVVDHQTGRLKGGTGQPFDWSRLPQQHRDRIIVAGGIGPDNAASAMQLGCAGLDMNSGLETSAGIKSPEKIRQAFQAIRSY